LPGVFGPAERLVELGRELVAKALAHFALDAFGSHLDDDDHTLVHRDGERLGAAHAAETGAEHELSA
jgi:hypothetical protein